MTIKTREIQIQGTPISRGIAIGKPYFFAVVEKACPDFSVAQDQVDKEIVRYRNAVTASIEEVKKLREQLEAEGAVEGAAVLDTHLQMLQDPLLTSVVEEGIRSSRRNAESVFQISIKRVEQKFREIRDPFFRERFKDIQDISRRVMAHLHECGRASLAHLPPNSIVFARELAPSDTAEAACPGVCAFVTEMGGATSHAAIVAKAKGIPFVTSVDFALLQRFQHSEVIVDGRTGDVILNPTQSTLAKYRQYQQQLVNHFEQLEKAGSLGSETYDGHTVKLTINVEMLNELDMMHKYGGEGVGLFRSEFIFLANNNFPGEDEQFAIYRRLVDKTNGLPVVIRTFDIGGDKFPDHQHLLQETQYPSIGCRAIRFLLKEREIFKAQLRAILRASAFGSVSVLFPMISSLTELLEAKQLMKEASSELKKAGVKIAKKVPIGCMIEVPAAAVIADLLAKESDFLSIGTNDLAQYALALDRTSQETNPWYAPTHPAIIRLIKLIVMQANQEGVPVTVCGEIAADPRFTPLLIGLGVNELSVALRYLPVVKNAMRSISYFDALELADTALRMKTASEIQGLLTHAYQANVPTDCLFNC
jgi:phosphotransferase system enzyme I (PtsI)